ncbi:polycystin-2-like [Branchiostoma floridae x Branchiostoma belcheri]
MVVYGLFLSVLMLMSYTERSNLAFHMNNSIRSALEGTFSTISDPASYWTWLEQDVLPAVHSPAWYNGRPCEENLTLSEHLTHAISPLQLRQIRITQEQDCTIPDAMAHIAGSCLDEYSASKLDTGSYDGNWGVAANYTNHDNSTDNRTIPSPWDYTYGDINNGFLYVGEHGVYPSGGYIAALGRTLNDSLRTLTYLISNDWLDNRTRAVFTEAVLYNPHANLFAVVTMTTEFDITGRGSTATELVIFRIHHEGQVLLLVLRMGLIIFLLFSLVKEVLKFNTYGMVYLTDPWSWLEMLIITTGMAAMGLYARAQGMTDEVSEYLKEGHVLFHLYRAAAMWHQVYTYLLGALTCFTLVKFIRLLNFNKHVNALLYTMKKTAKPLVSFFVISGIVFTAFALAANLTLGIAMSGYSSLLRTYTSLFNMMLGSFQFAILEESSPVWGPAIFLSFQFTAQFLLLSMFMTIIMDVYMEVKSSEPEDMEMMAYLWEEVCGVVHKIKTIANRPETRQPAAREHQFTQLDQMHEMLEKLDRDEKGRRERRREERQIEETQREERERMIRYSEAPTLWFV